MSSYSCCARERRRDASLQALFPPMHLLFLQHDARSLQHVVTEHATRIDFIISAIGRVTFVCCSTTLHGLCPSQRLPVDAWLVPRIRSSLPLVQNTGDFVTGYESREEQPFLSAVLI